MHPPRPWPDQLKAEGLNDDSGPGRSLNLIKNVKVWNWYINCDGAHPAGHFTRIEDSFFRCGDDVSFLGSFADREGLALKGCIFWAAQSHYLFTCNGHLSKRKIADRWIVRDCTFIHTCPGNRKNSASTKAGRPLGSYTLENIWFEDAPSLLAVCTGANEQTAVEDIIYRNVRSTGPFAFSVLPNVPVRNWVFENCAQNGSQPVGKYEDLSLHGAVSRNPGIVETNTFVFKSDGTVPAAVPEPVGKRIEAETMTASGCRKQQAEAGLSGGAAVMPEQLNSLLSAAWDGEPGRYTITVRYYDDPRGQSHITLRLGDNDTVGTWSCCREDGGWHVQRFPGQQLQKGQQLNLQIRRRGKEQLLVDYIEIAKPPVARAPKQ